MIYITLEERHCYGHNEIDVKIERNHRRRTYNTISEASQQRLMKIFPTFYIELNDGVEL